MKLYFLGKSNNFGDAINADIFKYLYRQKVTRTKFYNAEYAAIGSILGKFFYNHNESNWSRQNLKRRFYGQVFRNQPVTILGSGIIEDLTAIASQLSLYRPLNLRLLRGEKTKKIMQIVTGEDLGDFPLGDPGLLVRNLFDSSNIAKKYRLGIIPHYADFRSPFLDGYRKDPDVTVIDIKSEAASFMRSVNECEMIASSSLHGLVVADSFAIPAVWIRLSNALTGGEFKFLDYFSAINVKRTCHDLRENRNSLQKMDIQVAEEVDQDHLSNVIENIDKVIKEVLH